MKSSILSLALLVPIISFYAHADRVVPHVKSSKLEALIASLKTQYAMENQSELRVEKLTEVDNLSYFIRFIDKDGSPEQAKLKAYLLGAQSAYENSITHKIPWFCPDEGSDLETRSYNGNPTLFVENMIYEALEKDIRLDPTGFTRSNGIGAYGPVDSYIVYGLQTKYPCYESVPKSQRVNGFVY